VQPLLKRRLEQDFSDPQADSLIMPPAKRTKTEAAALEADAAKYKQMRKIGKDLEHSLAEGKCVNQLNRDASW
jgi:hypothetical protein